MDVVTVHRSGEVRPEDARIEAKQEKDFDLIGTLARGVLAGNIRCLFIGGAAGLGKSFMVHKTFEDADPECFNQAFDADGTGGAPWGFVSGKVLATDLYRKLWAYRGKNQVVVYDDADGILRTEDGCNLLKAATDTKKKRRIAWGTEYCFGGDVPKSFAYEGSFILITNEPLEKIAEGNTKLAPHMKAILDRAVVVTVNIEEPYHRLIRLRSVARAGHLFDEIGGLEPDAQEEVLDFIEANLCRLKNSLSFRTAIKIGRHRKFTPEWKDIVERTELSNK